MTEQWLTEKLTPVVQEELGRTTEHILPEFGTVSAEQMREAIGIAIGRASVCWDSEGVFESEIAAQLVDELMYIARQFAERSETPIQQETENRSLPSRPKFRRALEELINSSSIEHWSNTPDFILAGYLNACLKAFDQAIVARDRWYLNGEQLTPAQTPDERNRWLLRAGLIPQAEGRWAGLAEDSSEAQNG